MAVAQCGGGLREARWAAVCLACRARSPRLCITHQLPIRRLLPFTHSPTPHSPTPHWDRHAPHSPTHLPCAQACQPLAAPQLPPTHPGVRPHAARLGPPTTCHATAASHAHPNVSPHAPGPANHLPRHSCACDTPAARPGLSWSSTPACPPPPPPPGRQCAGRSAMHVCVCVWLGAWVCGCICVSVHVCVGAWLCGFVCVSVCLQRRVCARCKAVCICTRHRARA